MGDDRPFACTAPGCGQRFTNEDHLSVHKHKHEMTLKFGPARTDSVIIADQTPTPTRFLKNCEEVGLFNELAHSFEQEFRKAQDDDHRTKHTAVPLQTPSEVKDEDEGPLQVDSSPPGSPDSASSMSDDSREPPEMPPKPVASSAPTPTIVRPGSLPLHMGYDSLNPTLPSPTSVITQTPPSNRQLGPVQMTSVISLARPVSAVPNIPGIPGPPVGGVSSGSSSPSGYSMHADAKMRLKAALTQQGMVVQNGSARGGAIASIPAVSPAQPTGGRRRRASDVDPDERRQRFLERNRAAASRCRQKRKVWVGSLEKKADDLANMNVSLSNEVTLLRNEVTQLKQLLLAHKDCPVTAMQKKAAFLAAGGEESSREPSAEPVGSPAAVIQHGPPPGASGAGATINGLSVRAAEAVAMSVLAGMGAGQPAAATASVVMTTQPTSSR
ncbi:hypothetical protein CRUP_022631 [Coryphaenoides rupestris]|nr:hypothetical protein CRUP_022631 [Coryphaenoides rupestris]